MGYYENPPIIQPSRGSEIISSAISGAASSIAQGLIARGERKRQEEKERKLTIQKLQDRKNETDLYYNEKLEDWSSKQTQTTGDVDKKIYSIVQEKIKLAADSRIALLNETDPEIRQSYLKNIRNADGFLNNSASFAKSIAGQTATWRLDTKAIKVGEAGGHVINGATDKEVLDNTAAVEILGGMTDLYQDTNVDINEDENGDGVILTVTGKHKDGEAFNVKINSKTFEKSEAEGDGGLLVPVEGLDTFHKKAQEDILDKKGNIYEGYLSQTRETVDLPSKGTSGGGVGDQYQIVNGQRLQDRAMKDAIRKKAEITATGILSADGPSRLRTLLNYTLKQGVGYYDNEFKKLNPEEQKSFLSQALTDKAFTEMTKSLERTTDKNGNVTYWNPTADIKLKDKPSIAAVKEEKPEPTTYKEEYYDKMIQGYVPEEGEDVTPGKASYRTRANLVENLNKLSGKPDAYITREELFKMYKKSPYKSGKFATGLTIEEAYEKGKIKGDIKEGFNKLWKPGEILMKEGQGAYKPLKGYDVSSASGRIKLALDQTSGEGERKILQGKLKEAKLMDWIKKNPKKLNESEQSYAIRANKSI